MAAPAPAPPGPLAEAEVAEMNAQLLDAAESTVERGLRISEAEAANGPDAVQLAIRDAETKYITGQHPYIRTANTLSSIPKYMGFEQLHSNRAFGGTLRPESSDGTVCLEPWYNRSSLLDPPAPAAAAPAAAAAAAPAVEAAAGTTIAANRPLVTLEGPAGRNYNLVAWPTTPQCYAPPSVEVATLAKVPGVAWSDMPIDDVALSAQLEAVSSGKLWPAPIWMQGAFNGTGTPFNLVWNGLDFHKDIAGLDVMESRLLDPATRTAEFHPALKFMLHCDLRSGYQGVGFGLPPDAHMLVKKFQLSQEEAEADALKEAIADMQETLDDYGIHNTPGMSENAHKRMYEKLHALTKAVDLHKQQRGGDVDHNRHVLMTALSDLIMRSPSILRSDPALHVFIHPEVLHTAANQYASLKLNRRNALLMRGYPPEHPMSPLITASDDPFDLGRIGMNSHILGEDDLTSSASIAKAIDQAKFEWLNAALSMILPSGLGGDMYIAKPFEELHQLKQQWYQTHLGVTRRAICAYAHFSIDTTAQLEKQLGYKGLKHHLVQLFFRDFTVLDTKLHNLGRTECLRGDVSCIGTGPDILRIVAGQPGFATLVVGSLQGDAMTFVIDQMSQADLDCLRRRVRIVAEVAHTSLMAASRQLDAIDFRTAATEPIPEHATLPPVDHNTVGNYHPELDWYFAAFAGLRELVVGRKTLDVGGHRRSGRIRAANARAKREGKRPAPYQHPTAMPFSLA